MASQKPMLLPLPPLRIPPMPTPEMQPQGPRAQPKLQASA